MTNKTPKKRKQDNHNDLSDEEMDDFKRRADFFDKILKLPEAQALEILRKAEEQDAFIASLEQSEYETFYSSNDKDNQQDYFDDDDWFFTNDDR